MVIKRKKLHRTAKRRSSMLSAKRRAVLSAKAKKIAFNLKTPIRAYREIEKKIDTTWKKLRNDVKNRSRKAILKGRQDLLLLLGECNYMARECKRCLKGKHPSKFAIIKK